MRALAESGRRLARAARVRLSAERGVVVYHPGYEAPANPLVDPKRSQKILGHLVEHGCLAPARIRTPEPLPVSALARVHDYAWLESLGAPGTLERIFPYGAPEVDLQAVLQQQRCMTSGTVLAARLALEHGRPAINLGGGFHHASSAHGEGFCIFNDLAVAVADLRASGFTGRVLVVDLDLHPGNGTHALFAADPTVFTFSLHARDWEEAPAVAARSVALGTAIGDHAYHEALLEHLPPFFAEADPALVVYVAGVDVAGDDGMGTWRLSSDAILARDRFVVERTGARPLVWTLAGGYGPNAWRHTARSLAWLLAGDDAPILSEAERALERYRRIKDRLAPEDLTGAPGDPFEITAEDVFGDLVGKAAPRLLGFYSLYGVETALERYGVLRCVRATGTRRVTVEMDPEHVTGQMVRVRGDGQVFIELVLRESGLVSGSKLLSIEWLLLQNPLARPTPERPLLPGQEHPGLGCLSTMILMLVMACERLCFDGLLFTPSQYHVAAIARGLLSFLDPANEARFLAIGEALQGLPLGIATQRVHAGDVLDEAGEPVAWNAAEMVLPVSAALKARFEGERYERAVEAAAGARFHLKAGAGA